MVWNQKKYEDLLQQLKENAEESYRLFSLKIIPTNYQILGVRAPTLTKLFNQIKQTDIKSYLSVCQDQYYEEVLLEGFWIASLTDPQKQLALLSKFLLKIDNWAICDMMINRMKIVKKNKEFYLEAIERWLGAKEEFIKRFGFVLLLNYYVEEDYLTRIFHYCDHYVSNQYYVQMAVAWLLSYCYLLDKKKTLSYLEKSHLDLFTYHKTIDKIRESRRIGKEEKAFLKSYYRKQEK